MKMVMTTFFTYMNRTEKAIKGDYLMKLMIELNDYEKLKNTAETANDKICKVKRLFYASCAMVCISVISMIYAIYFDETALTIVFFILALLFSCGAIKILCDPNAYFKGIYNMVQKMLEVSDEKSCIQMEYWTKNDDTFECYYFDKDGIMQKMIISYEKRYIHKYDYYKIAGKLNENGDNYIFYLYEPYKKGELL